MASTKSPSIGPSLSTAEQVGGVCYLPFYVVLLGLILEYLSGLFGLELTALQLNMAFFAINLTMTLVIFRRFLLYSLRSIRFWELIQAVILGIALYYAGNYLFSLAARLLHLDIPTYNDQTIQALAGQGRGVMLVCCVFVAPLVEETLVRGLLFGMIRRQNRIAAYVVSILFFCAIHVWQFLLAYDLSQVLLSALQYIPAGIALAWTYEKAGNIFGPILLHTGINAVAFGVMSLITP